VFSYCRKNLANYKCPTSIDWMETIPRNPSGKILKTELRKPYWKDMKRNVS
jgi:long-chain acyl-CoA synthetase